MKSKKQGNRKATLNGNRFINECLRLWFDARKCKLPNLLGISNAKALKMADALESKAASLKAEAFLLRHSLLARAASS